MKTLQLSINEEDLKELGLKTETPNKENRTKIREMLELSERTRTGNKQRALETLGLSKEATNKEVWEAIRNIKK